MSNTTKNKPLYDVTVEQVCERLKQVRDGMIGDEGEVLTVARMQDVEIYGLLYGKLEKWKLAPNHIFIVLEIPVGPDFPATDNGVVSDGFDLMS